MRISRSVRTGWVIRRHLHLLRGRCPLGLLDVILPGDRPGIVTDFVRAHMSCLWLLPSLNCQISSATEHLYLDVMSGEELGCG